MAEKLGAVNRQFLLQLAGAQMQSAATVLKYQDADNTGTDDLVANILEVGGEAILKYTSGDIKTVDANLKVLADAINAYLEKK